MSQSLSKSLCMPVTLRSAWKVVKSKNSAGGVDGLSVDTFEDNLAVNLDTLRRDLIDKQWNPEPYLRVEIEKKGSAEKRKLGLLSVRDKIVQQSIKSLIEPRLEKLFLNNNYGYRPGKGPAKAVHRTMHFINHNKDGWIAKLDIENYFDTIQHERLFLRLKNLLKDEEIIRLIELSVKTGMVSAHNLKWNETTKGIPQGAVLSPLLANFYLHPFDQFVTAKTPDYIRYADDFVILGETKEQVECMVQLIKEELKKTFFLNLNDPVIASVKRGVDFLGITVRHPELTLSEKKKSDLLHRIDSIELKGCQITTKSLETLQGIKNYYARLLPQSLLKELDSRLIRQIHEQIKRNKRSIQNKTALSTGLKELFFFAEDTELTKSILIKEFIDTYLDTSCKKGKNKKTDNKKLIRQKKREYQKREKEGAELVVSTPGSFIGKTHRGIQIKVRGEIIYRKPTQTLKHITVTGQGVTMSSNAMRYCVSQKIPVDFFDEKGKHYASLLSPVNMDGMLWQQQALLALDKRMELARRIILSKLKNQMSLIKYYHKYHKRSGPMLVDKYPETILQMEECLERIKSYRENTTEYAVYFMGQEAVAARAYWDYVRILIQDDGIDYHKREHQGATDITNCMLNYGYAILYARIWDTLLVQKLNPSISVLHAPQPGKPTLVFDVIELFRAQAVDRVVISLIQKKETLKLHKGLLSESTKRILIEAILDRLNRYEKYRGEELVFTDIIHRQVREIAAYICGEIKTFKPYLAKW